MRKKSGFTLIELLAVIVILAIIALIATPMILNVVEQSRRSAAKSSALGCIDAVEKQIMLNEMDNDKTNDIPNGTITVANLKTKYGVIIKGKAPESTGYVTITSSRIVGAELHIGNYEVTCVNGTTCDVRKVGELTQTEKVFGLTTSGLYDDNFNLIASWETLTTTYGLDIEKDYTAEDYLTETTSGYNVLENSALSQGAILVIPEGITKVGNNAFKGSKKIKSVKFSSTVESIGDYAFYNNTNLNAVVFAEGIVLETIGESSFEGDTSLTEIIIPASVREIKTKAFFGCVNLKKVVFEEEECEEGDPECECEEGDPECEDEEG